MKKSYNIFFYTAVGTILGAGLGMLVSKKLCSKTSIIKKTAARALRAAGSFVEHMSF